MTKAQPRLCPLFRTPRSSFVVAQERVGQIGRSRVAEGALITRGLNCSCQRPRPPGGGSQARKVPCRRHSPRPHSLRLNYPPPQCGRKFRWWVLHRSRLKQEPPRSRRGRAKGLGFASRDHGRGLAPRNPMATYARHNRSTMLHLAMANQMKCNNYLASLKQVMQSAAASSRFLPDNTWFVLLYAS